MKVIIAVSLLAFVTAMVLVGFDEGESTTINVPPSFEPAHSTGVLTGGVLTAGVGSNEYSISDGTGVIIDSTGKKTYVSWSGEQNRIPQDLNNYLLTWVSVNSTGGIVEQITKLDAEECRARICLGVVVHVDKTNVDTTNNEQVVAYNVRSQLNDLEYALGFFNVNGNVFSANGANLQIDKSEGQIYATGSNYNLNINEPNIKTLPSLSGGAFQYRFSNGDNGVTGTNIDPDNLDDGVGGLDPVGQNKWSIQRIYSFISNNVKIQRGTADYGTSDEAIAEIQNELSYVTEPSIAQNGILRGWLIVKQGATALNGVDAVFVEASKFGSGSGGGSGGSTGATVNDPNTDCGTDNHVKSLSLNNSTGQWTITCDADNTGSGGEANTYSSDGVGEAITKTKVGVDLPFKGISGGTDISVTSNSTDVIIAYTGVGGGGETNTASNVGTGVGVFDQKSGVNLEFNSLIGGNNISITDTTQDITIDSDISLTTTTCTAGDFVSAINSATGVVTCSTPSGGGGSYSLGFTGQSIVTAKGSTNYAGITGGSSGTENDVSYYLPHAKTAQNLRCYASASSTSADTTITVMKNSVATSIVLTYGSGVTGLQSDLVNTGSFSLGDRIDLRVINNSGGGGAKDFTLASCSIELA
jgi:hypothetical protein